MESATPLVLTGATRTRYGEAPLYAEGVYSLGKNVYAWMMPNGSWGETNAGLIVGQDESLLIDTLWDLAWTRRMLQAMQPLTANAPIRYVVNTHSDGDHFFGNELMAGCEIITSRAAYEEMQRTKPDSLVLLGRVGTLLAALPLRSAAAAGHWFRTFCTPYDFSAVTWTPANRTFEGELSLEVGGREVQLIEAGPAHTAGDLMVWVPDAKILFGGDLVFVGSTPAMWHGPTTNWLAALSRMQTMDVDTIVPGHGRLTDTTGAQQLANYWEYLVAEVRHRYDGGMPARRAAREVVLSSDFAQQPFAAWDSPERTMTNVHTLYRNWRGQAGPLSTVKLLSVMWQQALLAQELPAGHPAALRRFPAGARQA